MIPRIILVVLAAALLVAGCLQTPPPMVTPTPMPVPATMLPTPEPTTAAPPPTLDYIPGPLPSNFEVNADVDRNVISINPRITVTYRGGRGSNYVYSMNVVVTRADGQVIKDSILRPKVNDIIEIMGTTGTDRVQIFIQLITKDPGPGPYLIYDEDVPFRTRG